MLVEKENNNIVPINGERNVVRYGIEDIKNLIYTIRGKQVMLDSDVAMLYRCETRIINQAVKRNIDRFPERFYFKLTESEVENLKSQFVISSLTKENYGGRRKLPTVFTEQGIAMLSGLLRNEIAIQVSINIMDAFVEMRRFLSTNGQIYDRLSNVECKLLEQDRKLSNHEQNFEKVFDELQKNKKEEFIYIGDTVQDADACSSIGVTF